MEPGGGLVDVVDRGRTPEGWLEVLDAHGARRATRSRSCTPTTPTCGGCACSTRVVNNADRKGGHVLHGRVQPDGAPATYGVDHGVTFSEDEKLRTVLWGWAGERLDDGDRSTTSSGSRDALERRARRHAVASCSPAASWPARGSASSRRIREAAFPLPGDGWPSLPWPAF